MKLIVLILDSIKIYEMKRDDEIFSTKCVIEDLIRQLKKMHIKAVSDTQSIK